MENRDSSGLIIAVVVLALVLTVTAAVFLLLGASTVTSTGSGSAATGGATADQLRVYVGTYTGGESEGIYLFDFDPDSGRLESRKLAARTVNPSFLAVHPDGGFLYAVNEIGKFAGKSTGAVTAFAVDRETGGLTELNQVASGGAAPCHLAVDRGGRYVLVANYTGGNVAVFEVGTDGRLGRMVSLVQHTGSSVDPRRQKGPHAHCIKLDASNDFAFAADLGVDKVFVYRFDSTRGTLAPNAPPATLLEPGAGPRHLTFHPGGEHVYVINELQSTVTVFRYTAREGKLRQIQTVSTLPAGYDGQSTTAEIEIHPTGRFLYGSNRGHDSIAVFAVTPGEGKIRLVEHESTGGETPRNFALDPAGKFLLAANQGSNSIVVLRIDSETGALEPTGTRVEVASPVCVTFDTTAK